MKSFKAIGDWVFVKRDPVDTNHLGLDYSEKALTKNYLGVITNSGRNYKFVTNGQKVHLPHFGVTDYVIDGIEYAVVRDGDLFAIKSDESAFVPINQHVLVRKCVNDHERDDKGEVSLFRTDEHIETTNWVEIIDVSDDCEYITREDIGCFCIAPESSEKLQRLLYSKDYCLKEDVIKFKIDGENMIKPIGDTVILKLYNDGIGEFGIEVASKVYEVVSFGTGLKSKMGIIIPLDLEVGEKVVLKDEGIASINNDGVKYFYTSEDNISITIRG